MLGRVVVVGQQCLLVLYDPGYGLGPLGRELGGELLDGFGGLLLVLRVSDLLYGRLGPPVDALGQAVEDVRGSMDSVG
jgi:hypothetical protein